MHQPYYKHPTKGHYILPWVRLHGVKDYYGMAKLVEKFDKVKVSFNFSGILIEQLLDYTNNDVKDIYQVLTLKDPAYLTNAEKNFIVDRFFSINHERFITPHKRYNQLLSKKLSPKGTFSNQDILDLQALFNLCWFHPFTVAKDKQLKDLKRKGKGYTKTDKEYIVKKQYDVLREVIPLYKRLLDDKRIELTVTPYQHPIIPLIYDTDILKDTPYLKMPHHRFSSKDDCAWHLQKAKEVCKHAFDYDPKGSWPSEGSVSEPIASIYAKEGFSWIATDEAILFKSLTSDYVPYEMIKDQRHMIYRPYNFDGINIFFRDRNLSDAMSFTYQGWEDPVFAANDMLEHCKRTHYHTKNLLKNRAITIIMDGENAWEYYKNDGIDFLETIYSGLEHSSVLHSTTPSEYLKKDKGKKLERLSSGSWINGDFGVWIGSKENNAYWDKLRKVKELVDKKAHKSSQYDKIMEYFHLIEGSDWFWWNTFQDHSGEFKNIFCSYIEEMYKMMGKNPPARLRKHG